MRGTGELGRLPEMREYEIQKPQRYPTHLSGPSSYCLSVSQAFCCTVTVSRSLSQSLAYCTSVVYFLLIFCPFTQNSATDPCCSTSGMAPDIGFVEKRTLCDKFANSNAGSVPLILFNEDGLWSYSPTSKSRRELNAANISGIVPDKALALERLTAFLILAGSSEAIVLRHPRFQ